MGLLPPSPSRVSSLRGLKQFCSVFLRLCSPNSTIGGGGAHFTPAVGHALSFFQSFLYHPVSHMSSLRGRGLVISDISCVTSRFVQSVPNFVTQVHYVQMTLEYGTLMRDKYVRSIIRVILHSFQPKEDMHCLLIP
jgi:hypothetical protein